jgi:hypothetical protein
MKKLILLVACSLLVIFSCKKSSTTSDVHLNAGLLVYLPFNGTIADSSGNGNTVNGVSGAALTTDQKGNANSAFGGNGTGQRLLVSNNGSIQFSTDFTVSIDVLINNVQPQLFISMVDNTDAKGVSLGIGTDIPGLTNLDFSATDSLSTCNAYGGPTNAFNDTTPFIPQTNTWYNVIGTYHNGNMAVYLNGKTISTFKAVGTSVPICSSAKLIIGGWWDGDPQSINGKLDEVRLYNRVLNTDEIAALAKNFQ